MTGTIEQLMRGTRSGIVRAEDGCQVLFSASAVLGDFDTLAVGQRVRFDFDRGWSEAMALRVLPEPAPSDSRLDLRYAGFDQTKNVRHYKFDAVARGQSTRRFVVTVDVALFLKHHVAMQEGPALCLRKLMSNLEAAPASLRHELVNDDLLAYVSARAAAVQRKARPKPNFDRQRHGPPPAGPWSSRPQGPR